MNAFLRLCRNDSAVTMVEYAIMLAFIAAVCITAVAIVGSKTKAQFDSVSDAWPGA